MIPQLEVQDNSCEGLNFTLVMGIAMGYFSLRIGDSILSICVLSFIFFSKGEHYHLPFMAFVRLGDVVHLIAIGFQGLL